MGISLTPICPADRGKNWIFLSGEETHDKKISDTPQKINKAMMELNGVLAKLIHDVAL
jgi:GTP cyclohydrolase I